MNFDSQQEKTQADWKKSMWPELPPGEKQGRAYHHILPNDHWQKNLYPPILEPVQAYCGENHIQLHSGLQNLKSSSACCYNIMFPLRLDKKLAAKVLAPVFPGLQEVIDIDFEFTGPADATEWLGEPKNGKRGMNRTSIDVAVTWKDSNSKIILSLCEWKYTERSFGTCGGYVSKGNTRRDECINLYASDPSAPSMCYLTKGGNQRRYWQLLQLAGIDLSKFTRQGCPFIGPFYQLLRQFLLAAYMRQTRDFDQVEVVSMAFWGNKALTRVPSHLSYLGSDIYQAWNHVLTGVPPLRKIAVQEIVAGIQKNGSRDHGDYLRIRYCPCKSMC